MKYTQTKLWWVKPGLWAQPSHSHSLRVSVAYITTSLLNIPLGISFLLTVVANIKKGHADMPFQGEDQTLT